MNDILSFLFAVFCISNTAFCQSITVKGTVTDPDGTVLPGATILLRGSAIGAATAPDGSFQMQIPDGQGILTVSYLGYETQEIAVTGRAFIPIQLEASTSQLDEVVVLGFGSQRKRHLTSAISSVDHKVFENSPAPSFQRSLQGRMPGVVVTNASGGLNAEAIIRIRGTGSISAGNQPLIVVDGLILAALPAGVLGYPTNPFLNLEPNDIASVEVLKDAAAAAIYGSRGSNGVILITTKQGQFNAKPRVNLSHMFGFMEISKKRDLLSGPEYATLWNTAATNAGHTTAEDPGLFYANPAAEPTADWQGLLLQKGFVQEVTASVSGGSPDTKYYIGGSVMDQDFYLRTIGLKRYSVRANFEQKISETVTAGLSISPSRIIDNRTGNQWAGSAWGAASWYLPNVEALDENGECRRDPLFTSIGERGNAVGNPCTVLEDQWIEATRSQVLMQADLGWSPLRNLHFSTNLAAEFNRQKQELKFGSSTWFGYPAGWALSNQREVSNYNWTSLASWQPLLVNGHSINATAGIQLTKEAHDFLTIDGSGFGDDRVRYVGSASLIEYVATSQSDASFIGYLARLNYAFQNRYLLTLSARYDGSSRFGSANRYGFFPALSAGWIVSDEPFFDVPGLGFLKLRSSIGLAGNAGIDNYAALGLTNFNVAYSGQPGSVIQTIENKELSWEKNLQWDAGLEFSLWNGRLGGSVEYFIKDTRDLLLELPVPSTNGISFLTSNVGAIRNQGLEFDLNVNVLKGNFNWNVLLNGATLKNEVRQLADQDHDGDEDDIVMNGMLLFRPGQPVSSFYLERYAGVDPNNGDALFFWLDGTPSSTYVPDASRQIVGKSIPSFTGGCTHVFQYKNFDLSAFFHFKTGHKVYMEDGNMEQNGTWGNNQHRSQLNHWTPQNRDTDVPQPRLDKVNGTQRSTRYLEPGSFLRLQRMDIGYTIKNIGRANASLRLYAAADNLLTFTKFRGLDPDSEFLLPDGAAMGFVRFNLPAARIFSFGVNVEL